MSFSENGIITKIKREATELRSQSRDDIILYLHVGRNKLYEIENELSKNAYYYNPAGKNQSIFGCHLIVIDDPEYDDHFEITRNGLHSKKKAVLESFIINQGLSDRDLYMQLSWLNLRHQTVKLDPTNSDTVISSLKELIRVLEMEQSLDEI